MTAQTETLTPVTRVTRFGVTTAQGDTWTVTVTQWQDGWTVVDATLPDGFWGNGPHNMDDLLVGRVAPTLKDITRAIDDRVEADADAAWHNGMDTFYSR
jgi:hypothetical protein